MKTAEQSIIDFLRSSPSKYSSASLQRMNWKNKNGTLASPRSIVRRLEENTCTQDNPTGVLEVSYDDHGNAVYQIKQEHRKKIYRYETVMRDGVPYARQIIEYA